MYTANRRTSRSFKASGKKIRPVQDAKLNTLFKTHESKNYALFSSTYPSRPNKGVPSPPGVLISAFGCKTKQYQIFLYSPKSD